MRPQLRGILTELTPGHLQGCVVLPATGTYRECALVSGTLACERCALLLGPERTQKTRSHETECDWKMTNLHLRSFDMLVLDYCTGIGGVTGHRWRPGGAQTWLFDLKRTIQFVVGL